MLSNILRRTFLILVFALAVSARSTEAQGVRIVVNGSTETGDLTAASVAKIFLKQERKFASGTSAFPVDLPKTSTTRAAFSKEVIGRSTSAVEQYWLQQLFAGKDTPPPAKSSDEEVVDFVKRTPGAIGYISATAELPSGVKAITLK